MGAPPIETEKAEEIILYYMIARYQWLKGQTPYTLGYAMKCKARELGFSLASAYRLVRYARSVGMVDGKRY